MPLIHPDKIMGKTVDNTDIPTDTQVLTFNGGKNQWDSQDSGSAGEANTSSNAGAGDGWALAKSGVDLPFKSIITSSPLSTTVNANDLTLTLDLLVNADIAAAAAIAYSKLNLTTSIIAGDMSASADVMLAGIEFIIDGGGSVITTGVKGYLEVPFDCTIERQTLLADQTGSIVIDIWKDTFANFPPLVADTITASAKPTISAGVKDQDATLTGWTTAISEGDILAYNVDSVTTIERVTMSLKVRKT